MDLIFLFGLNTSLFLIPFIIYYIFFKKSDEDDSEKGFFYFGKLYFANAAVKNHQEHIKKKLKPGNGSIEEKNDFESDQHVCTQYFFGADQKDNNLSLKFVLRANKKAEVSLCLRLKDNIYVLPGKQSVAIYSITQNVWRVKDLQIEILEPFKRARFVFNGFLLNVLTGETEHVQFNFLWMVGASPKYFPHDANTALLAESIASEKWRDGGWANLLQYFDYGFETLGALKGFVKGDSFPKEQYLNLPASRSRFNGIDNRLLLKHEIKIFIAADDGTLINFSIKSFKKGCSGLRHGVVIFNEGTVCSIDYIDIDVSPFIRTKNLPEQFTIHVKAGIRVFKCVIYVDLDKVVSLQNDEEIGSLSLNSSAHCDINEHYGKAIIEFWQQKSGKGIEYPPSLLSEAQIDPIPSDLVVNISEPNARVLEITGGKGNSLALLASLKSQKFTVPDGFIISINAFQEQIKWNDQLKEAILTLENICCGQISKDLNDACEKVVEMFKSTPIVPIVKEAILNKLNKREQTTNGWAIRSSAIGEDSEELSAAGQNETFLGCRSEIDILKAVSACWASLFTFQSVQYRWQHGLKIFADMAVVVQEMVSADSAGVLFTCHPTTSDPSQMVVTANYGLGESVVSGLSDPDTFVIERSFAGKTKILEANVGHKSKVIHLTDSGVAELQTKDDLRSKACISNEQALKLAEVGIDLENAYGCARDIEWAFFKNKLYLLQSRPVTTVNAWTDYELLHEFDNAVFTEQNVFTIANVGEVCPGAVTVLSQSSVLSAVDVAYQRSLQHPIDKNAFRCLIMMQQHLMINVCNGIHSRVTEKIEVTDKILDVTIFGHPVINETIQQISLNRFGTFTGRKKFTNTMKMASLAWNLKKIVEDAQKLNKQFVIQIKDTDSVIDIYKKIENSFHYMEEMAYYHCSTSSISTFYEIISMTILLGKAKELTMDHYTDFALILSSCEDVVSAEVPTLLEEIARVIRKKGAAEKFLAINADDGVSWLKNNCPEASKLLSHFLDKHGHRLFGEFEMKEDTWGMDPSKVIKMLQANCIGESKPKKKTETVDEILSKLKSPINKIAKQILKFIIIKMKISVSARENTKSELVRSMNKYRIAYRILADKLVENGYIPSRDLIYHWTHHEIGELIRSKSPALINKAMRRQKLYPKWNELRFPEIMYGIPEAEKDEIQMIEGGAVCKGVPVCSGNIKARACVILNLKDIGQLKSGDILITHATDIGWSPCFPMLSGVVTELGGLISHGAVVAREYGLPCIVGAQNATKMFKTGDIIYLSGETGTLGLASES